MWLCLLELVASPDYYIDDEVELPLERRFS
jgi:hypothetical protein